MTAAIHYYRVPPSEWEDRMLKAQMGGMNTIQTYKYILFKYLFLLVTTFSVILNGRHMKYKIKSTIFQLSILQNTV